MRGDCTAAAIIVGLVPASLAAKHVTTHTEHVSFEHCMSQVLSTPPDAGERDIQKWSATSMIVEFRTADSTTRIICDKSKGTKVTTDTDFMLQ